MFFYKSEKHVFFKMFFICKLMVLTSMVVVVVVVMVAVAVSAAAAVVVVVVVVVVSSGTTIAFDFTILQVAAIFLFTLLCCYLIILCLSIQHAEFSVLTW